ncbi:hypothetical protein B0W44_02725 [Novibacillus thermophilus]|uniref:YdbS-like PH domain-containing protein n=2 Tax=Novibacillus thermophilus TaxID=1471761 RepID=A0A1U9K488_9BACL|nr:hypothetical protein B0W44_02725 [Novibacillus thermophilus]
MMSEPRRLHPATVLMYTLRLVRQFIIPVALFVFFQANGEDGPVLASVAMGVVWFAVGVIVLIAGSAAWGYIAWRHYTYRIENGEFRIEHGVLNKKRRYIPLERIQTVDFVEGIVHRLFRVVKVRVETAGGTEPEANLEAVARPEAEQLRHFLNAMRNEPDSPSAFDGAAAGEQGETDGQSSAAFGADSCERRITLRELLIAGVTSGSVGVIFSLVGGAFSFFDDLLPLDDVVDRIGNYVSGQVTVPFIALIAVTALVVAWLAATLSVALKFGNFRVKRAGDYLSVERGLLERRRSTLPIKRIQSVRLVEGVLRQPFGYVTVHVVSAGYGGSGSDSYEEDATVIFPLMAKKDVVPFLDRFVPEFAPEDVKLERLPRRAWRRFVVPGVAVSALVALLLSYFFDPWGWLSWILVPLAVGYGTMCYSDEGWHLAYHHLVVRSRSIARTTAVVTRRRIQSSTLKQSPFQLKADLATFQVNVASGSTGKRFSVRHVDRRDGERLLEWASHRRNRQVKRS